MDIYACELLAKSPQTIKNIQNDYTKYSDLKLDQTQYIVAKIEFEQTFLRK